MKAEFLQGGFIHALLSAALLMPMLIWPSFLLLGVPAQEAMIFERWTISAIVLLLFSTVADAYCFGSGCLRYGDAIWILVATTLAATAPFVTRGLYFIAVYFGIHSLAAATCLWKTTRPCWLWTSWCRDTLSAASIFTFLACLGHA